MDGTCWNAGRYYQKWHSVDEVLLHFGKDRRRARSRYLEFIRAGEASSDRLGLSGGGLVRSYGGWESISQLRKEHIICIGDERILGESGFIERVLKGDDLTIESRSRLRRDGWTLDKLLDWVCKYCEVEQVDLCQRSRENSTSRAKALICYLGVEKLGIKSAEIAKQLGISRPAVSKWISKGRIASRDEVWFDLFG